MELDGAALLEPVPEDAPAVDEDGITEDPADEDGAAVEDATGPDEGGARDEEPTEDGAGAEDAPREDDAPPEEDDAPPEEDDIATRLDDLPADDEAVAADDDVPTTPPLEDEASELPGLVQPDARPAPHSTSQTTRARRNMAEPHQGRPGISTARGLMAREASPCQRLL